MKWQDEAERPGTEVIPQCLRKTDTLPKAGRDGNMATINTLFQNSGTRPDRNTAARPVSAGAQNTIKHNILNRFFRLARSREHALSPPNPKS